MFDSNRVILLPIETKVREFHGKLLLAAVAAEAGFDVVIGEQSAITRQIGRLPPGIYIDKSVARTKTRHFHQLRKLGHRVVAWCEEGLVFRDRDTYLHERVSVASLDQADVFFAWGDAQADAVLSKAPHAANKIVCSGNPRFDILRPGIRDLLANEADVLRRTHGPFILINTNFSRFNHFNGREFVIDVLKQRGTIKTSEQEAFFRRWGDYLGVLYREFAAMLPDLSTAFATRNIILRPHPSENHEAWRAEVKNLPNVKVIHEGSPVPWILACDVLVHNSCTTGVEAYLVDRPVIAYRPVTDEVLDSYLPNILSHEAYDRAALIDMTKAIVAGGRLGNPDEDRKRREAAHRYITALDGPLAAERVVEALQTRVPKSPTYQRFVTPRLIHTLESTARPILSVLRRAMGRSQRYEAYARQKFSGIALRDVTETLAGLQAATNRFATVKARALPGTALCFHITNGQA
ncbi:MAG: hypothetical protein L0Y67_07035 [Gammaproteobacteria bacterium]|nr:hypothetical protein [Gammaproteobacteria bacterium]MCI0591338.1 hypothetical protein [Gammaproteobacteria bacterium]